jgi:hypothetical protein
VPQKKPLGKAISEDAANWRKPLDALAAVDAARAGFEELLQAEKNPAGSAAARLAPRADRTNSRRVRRKKGSSCDRVVKFVASVVFDELSVPLASQRIVKRFEKTAQRKLARNSTLFGIPSYSGFTVSNIFHKVSAVAL